MRVVGGSYGGRRLRPAPPGVRPTSDRVREALYARLEGLEGARVLDLYAGTGALGIEALSRGAKEAVFVDRAPRALAALRANLAALGLGATQRVVRGDAVAVVARLGRDRQRFDLVLLDPPYAAGELGRALEAIEGADLLAAGALVVVEHSRRQPLPRLRRLAAVDQRRYGDTVISRLAAASAALPEGGRGEG